MTDNEKVMVAAVRADPKVGRGSLSSIEECFEDSELLELFTLEGAETAEAAVKAAYEREGIWREQGLDAVASSGEEVDPYWRETFKEKES